MKFEGIYTPAITPLGPDGEIDRKAFAEVLESLIAAGVHGIIVGGSTGEYYAQTDAGALRQLAAFAKEVIGTPAAAHRRHGRDPDGGLGRLRQGGQGDRRDAILVASPPYALPTERENAVHALTIDRAANLPIMLYNYPARMGVMMGEEYFARVGRSKNVVAIKESSGDIGQMHLLARRVPAHRAFLRLGRPGAGVLRLGGAGAGSAPARTSCRKEHIALYEACVLEKNFDKGRRDHDGHAAADGFPRGRQVRPVDQVRLRADRARRRARLRAPLRPLNEDEKRGLQTVVANLKRTVAQITSGANHDTTF